MPYQVKSSNTGGTVVCNLNAPELGDGVLIGPDFKSTRVTLSLKDPTEIPFDIRIESPSLKDLEIITPFHLRSNIVLSGNTKKLNVQLYGIDRSGPISGEDSKVVIKEDSRSTTSGRSVTLVVERIGPSRESRLPSEVAQGVKDQTQLRIETNLALDATVRDCSNCTLTFAGNEEQGSLHNLIVSDAALYGLHIEDSISSVENLALDGMSVRELRLTAPMVRCTLSMSRILGGVFNPSRLVRLEVPRYVKLQDTEVNIGTLNSLVLIDPIWICLTPIM